MLDVPRIPTLTSDRLASEYINRGKPVVLTDMTTDWPALSRWTWDYLKAAGDGVVVPIRGNRYHFRLLGTTSLPDYVDWLIGDHGHPLLDTIEEMAPYISHNRGLSSRLESDVDFGRFVPAGYRPGAPALWIGPPNAETPLHYDSLGVVFFAQMVGRKAATLYTSDQSRALYESSYFDYTTCYSRVNLDRVDAQTFPKFATAVPYRTVLNPGDVLVFPRRLWHEFRTLGRSVSVTVHAGTARDYSFRNPMFARERLKQALHWFGLYARNRCSCHSNTDTAQWRELTQVVSNSMSMPGWIKGSQALTWAATRISPHLLHSNTLSDVMKWQEPPRREVEAV